MLVRIIALVASLLALVGVPTMGQASTQAHLFHALGPARSVGSAYTPTDIKSAYDMQSLYQQGLDGTGQTIALIEVDTYDQADLRVFNRQFGVADPAVTEYYAGGVRFNVPVGGEATMDLEWAHALAPGARIQIYYLRNSASQKAGWLQMASVLNQAAINGATVVSMSLGTCGPGNGYTATKQALASLMSQGISVFVSSGDDGDHPGPTKDCGRKLGVSYPASDPSVVAVGGTSLNLDSFGSIADEVGWDLSGGGKDKTFKRPVWQLAPQLPADNKRWVPDVSFVGDPATGVRIMYKGAWHQGGGTSLGAPCWAASWALIRQDATQAGRKVGAAPAILYKVANSADYARTFHDITNGSNGTYTADVGWDAVTGWGTPDIANLARVIVSKQSVAGR